jgi:dCMP deaminase
MEKLKWNTYFMTMVYLIAMKSKDQKSHLGAVIVGPDREVRSTGYNGLPRGCNDNLSERQERPEKYFWFEHAERNAIYNAARTGIPLKGCTMFTNGVPCTDCARGIIQVGIKRVIVHKEWVENTPPHWENHAKRSKVMLYETGVDVDIYDGPILGPLTGLRDGEFIQFQTQTD